MKIKVATWNVHNRNRDSSRFSAFVAETRADIYALQELSDRHVTALRQVRGFKLFIAEDFIERGTLTYLGILTKLPAKAYRVATHNPKRVVSESLVGRTAGWRECLQSQSLSVGTSGREIQLVNLHLAAAVGPSERRRQLEEVMRAVPERGRSVVCGDFNSFAMPLLNHLVGPGFGFRPRDYRINEVRNLKAFMAEHGFAPTHAAPVTYPKTSGRLDHIFVRGLKSSAVPPGTNLFGSDHRPLCAVLG